MLRTTKDLRGKLMLLRVLALLEDGSVSLDDPAIMDSLEGLKREVTGPSMWSSVELWERWIRTKDRAAILGLRESDDETSIRLRNLSPLNVLLSEDDRIEILCEVHGRAQALLSA
ncbi:hypothetical protein ACGFQG_32205 [Nocardia fluminea]|uniref:hypothetical protein n=1 Tax=Nocardia fluminea TaxID=134984 RepID=UPI003722819B